MSLTLALGPRTRVAVLVGLAAALTSCPAPMPPPDAGADGDASRDSDTDAWSDPVEVDARVFVDADRDALTPAGDPGWSQVAALPEECPIDMAAFPERVAPPVVWTGDCGAGCRSWGNTANLFRVGTNDGAPTAVLVASPSDPEERRLYTHWVVLNLDSHAPIVAFRVREPTPEPGDANCFIFDVGFGSSSLGLTVTFFDYDVTGEIVEREWTGVLRAELAAPRETLRLIARENRGGVMASVMQLSETHVATLWNWATVRAFGEHGAVLRPTYGLEEFSGRKTNLEILGDSDLVWAQWRSPTVLAGSRTGAPPTVLRSVDGGMTRGSDIRGFAAEGTTLAWLEAHDWNDPIRAFEHVELWTGTYGADGTILEPRRVADVAQASDGGMGAGLYVHAEPLADPTDAIFAIYRLSDGARAVVDPDPGPRAANDVLYVSDDMVIVEAFGQKYWIDPRELTFEAP